MQLRRHILLVASLTALCATAAQACPSHTRTTASAVKPAATPAATAAPAKSHVLTAPTLLSALGMRVAIDPVDGTLSMPTSDQLSNELRIDDDAPVSIFRRPNGSTRAQLDERFAEFAVATLGPDGKPAWTCVQGLRGAAQFMKQPVVPVRTPVVAAPASGTVWEEK